MSFEHFVEKGLNETIGNLLPTEMIELIMSYYVNPKKTVNEEIIKTRGKFSNPSQRLRDLLVDEGCSQLSSNNTFSYFNFVDSWAFSMPPISVMNMTPHSSFYKSFNPN